MIAVEEETSGRWEIRRQDVARLKCEIEGYRSLDHLTNKLEKEVVLVGGQKEARSGCKTHSPGTSGTSDKTTRDHHGPDTLCTLEEHATQSASDNAVGSVVFTTVVANERVEAVVDHGNNTSRVAQERTAASDGVQGRVEAKLWRR